VQYRLIALDLDGTLLTSRKVVSPRTREALRAARARGIVTAVATGRAPDSARQFSRLIGGGPIICCNGAGVLDEAGEFLLARGIPGEPLIRSLAICREAGLLTECYTDRSIVLDQPWAHMKAFMNWMRPKVSLGRSLTSLFGTWRSNRMIAVRDLRRWAEKAHRPPVLKVMILGKGPELPEVVQRLHREVPGVEISSSGDDNLELTAAGISKGSGLQILGAHLQIPREAMMAFGDSDNDLEMLRYAGCGVAMGNATERVRTAADRVTGSCDEDGIARAIEELCLG